MNHASRKKLYCYVDESGQDTGGRIFVVGVVVLQEELEKIKETLEAIEEKSGKKNIKWHKARYQSRIAYLEAVARTTLLENTIYFETFTNTKQYLEMTTYATAKAIFKRAGTAPCAVSVYVDGLSYQEVVRLSTGLRDLNVRRRKVKGVRKEENNVFIRLADTVCGLVRDAQGGNDGARALLKELKKKGIVNALKKATAPTGSGYCLP